MRYQDILLVRGSRSPEGATVSFSSGGEDLTALADDLRRTPTAGARRADAERWLQRNISGDFVVDHEGPRPDQR